MEAQKKNRRVLRGAVTRYVNELQSMLVAVTTDVEGIQVAWNMLSQKYEDLRAADAVIYAGLLEDNTLEEQDLATEVDECDAYIKKYMIMKVKCEKLLEEDRASGVSADTEVDSAVSNGSMHRQLGKRKFKLPVIEFKRFDGNIKDWLPFWGQFKKVHEAKDIDENDKIDYLTQATVPGSRARQLVESFPALADNYEKIVDSLKARFGREDLQVEVYVRGLLRLILVNATSTSRPDISSLYDEIETQLRALDTLGITSGQCSAIIFPLIESCLPEDLLRVLAKVAERLAECDIRFN